ncbi:MAG: hypothetical protein H6779_00475 [Candidatus Nomurabacteria bacterium]|nr:hypothetical protein [Candidatus Nomurabacteria bacterium]USN87905.1 MAG: hypothetical protein H6779_00475 [Candidatus Nomurabacteria bacterium]
MKKLLNLLASGQAFTLLSIIFIALIVAIYVHRTDPVEPAILTFIFATLLVAIGYSVGYYSPNKQYNTYGRSLSGDVKVVSESGNWSDFNRITKWGVEKLDGEFWHYVYIAEITPKINECDRNTTTLDHFCIEVRDSFSKQDILSGNTRTHGYNSSNFFIDDDTPLGRLMVFCGNLIRYEFICRKPPEPGMVYMKTLDGKTITGQVLVPGK